MKTNLFSTWKLTSMRHYSLPLLRAKDYSVQITGFPVKVLQAIYSKSVTSLNPRRGLIFVKLEAVISHWSDCNK